MERSSQVASGARSDSWLSAGGDAARDLLSVDWEKTPLGPPQTWPLSLSTTVRTLLSSRFSMWMAWGPEQTFFCNDAYRRDTLGSKYPWALGRPASEVWSEIWPEIGPRIETVLRTGHATWDESLLLFLERSGYVEETYHTFSYSPLPGDDGQIAGMLCVVTEDTERVISERRMATLRDVGNVPAAAGDARDFLRAAGTHLALNRQSLPFTVTYLFDEAGNATLGATTRLSQSHPIAPEQITAGDPGSPWPLEALLSEEVVIDDLPAALPTGVSDVPPAQAYAVPLQQVGDRRPYGFLAVGINQHRPFDTGYRAFIRLIAQRLAAGVGDVRSLEFERRRAEQLAELDRAKTAFFSNVSHEFRTPLTLMLAPLEDAMVGADGMPPAQVELVHRNGMRLLKLVNALLDFSRLEAGRVRAEFRPVEVGRLTSELAGTFSDACRRAGVELRIDANEPSEPAYIDPDLWERVVLNLVSNAFKVTLEGHIAVRVGAVNGWLELAVDDTGRGIPPGELDRLFQRFHRVASLQARSNEGTGIGLALVKELVELHGGEVSVQSTVGEGSCFTVRIPLGREHLPPEQVIDETAQTAPTTAALFVAEALGWIGDAMGADAVATGGQSDAQVLVADDNPDLRGYLLRLLGPLWHVQTVSDGAAALEQIRRDPPDLLVTDVMMPGLDGFELLREIRAGVRTRELPVIMLSARAGEEAAIEGLGSGADDYLPKPFSGRELVARVKAHLEMAQVRRKAADELRAKSDRLEEALSQLLRSQQLIAAQRDILALIAGGATLERSLHEIVRWTELIVEPGARVAIMLADDDGRRLHHGAAPALPDEFNAAIDGIAVGPAAGSCGTAAHRRETVIVEDVDQDPLWEDLRELATAHGLRASWSVPIMATDGRVVGTFAVYHDHPAAPTEDDLRVLELLARTAAVAIERSRDAQARAHQLAELQSSLLPRELPEIPGLGVAASFRPGDRSLEVGGDFYDVFEISRGCWGFIVGDVCGHGAEAAAVTALTRHTAKAIASREPDPTAVLTAVSDALRRSGYDRFCTAVYGRLELTASRVEICLASGGHPAPLVRRADGRVRTLSDHGPLLGVFEDPTFPRLAVTLEPGDALVAYTDGLVERNPLVPDGEALAALLGSLPAGDAPELIAAIEHEAIPPIPAAGHDDIAILVLRAAES
ncbi:MAG TPA: SpoIIE family protein phosphatase [Solirubrobacteraceae bacterium]|nr:SpoIIE family protein phosphatase [Solirubrobacteraceae bacterium]